MPKAKVTKEQILDTALKIIIRDGHEALNIKTVSKEIGHSTQTVSWTFGNMKKFREEVFDYALDYVDKKMYSDSENPIEEYGRVGVVYIYMAYDEPNLIRFLRSDEKRFQERGGFGQSLNEAAMQDRYASFARMYGCSVEDAKAYMTDMMVYTSGLVSMILSGALKIERHEACKMLDSISNKCILALGKKKEGV